jgi:hypothetical protein
MGGILITKEGVLITIHRLINQAWLSFNSYLDGYLITLKCYEV